MESERQKQRENSSMGTQANSPSKVSFKHLASI